MKTYYHKIWKVRLSERVIVDIVEDFIRVGSRTDALTFLNNFRNTNSFFMYELFNETCDDGN